eukprot:jgi/Chlat1/6947/Chrsp52S06617
MLAPSPPPPGGPAAAEDALETGLHSRVLSPTGIAASPLAGPPRVYLKPLQALSPQGGAGLGLGLSPPGNGSQKRPVDPSPISPAGGCPSPTLSPKFARKRGYKAVRVLPPLSPTWQQQASGLNSRDPAGTPSSPGREPFRERDFQHGLFQPDTSMSPPSTPHSPLTPRTPLLTSPPSAASSALPLTPTTPSQRARTPPHRLPPLLDKENSAPGISHTPHLHAHPARSTPLSPTPQGTDVSARYAGTHAGGDDPNNAGYMALLYSFRAHPASTDFVYLRRRGEEKESYASTSTSSSTGAGSPGAGRATRGAQVRHNIPTSSSSSPSPGSRVRVRSPPQPYNPYDLEVVPFQSVDQSDFFTMSARGVTRYLGAGASTGGGGAEFTSLDQWEREWQLFRAMRELKAFAQFREWKAFTVWRRSVRRARFRRAQVSLSKSLFQLNPVFQLSLQKIRALCFSLSSLRLHHLLLESAETDADRGCQPCAPLHAFVEAQRQHLQLVYGRLDDFQAGAVATVAQACKSALEQLEERLGEFYGKQESDGVEEGGGQKEHSNGHGAMLKGRSNLHASMSHSAHALSSTMLSNASMKHGNNSNGDEPANKYAYTIAAARRSEQRKLLCYVKLADYMIWDTLQDMLVKSVGDLLVALTPADDDQTNTEDDNNNKSEDVVLEAGAEAATTAGDEKPTTSATATPDLAMIEFMDTSEGAAGSVNTSHEPLFCLEVLYREGELLFEPSAANFQDETDRVLNSYVDTLTAVKRLLNHDDLKRYVIEPGAGGEAVSEGDDTAAGFQEVIHGGGDGQGMGEAVKAALAQAFQRAEEFKAVFEPFRQTVVANSEISWAHIRKAYEAGERPLEKFREDIVRFDGQKASIERISPASDIGILRVESGRLRAAFLPSPVACLDSLNALLPDLAHALYTAYIAEIHDATARLSANPTTVEEFVEQLRFAEATTARQKELDDRLEEITHVYEIIDEFGVPVPELQHAAYQTLTPDVNAFKTALEEVEATRDDNVTRFSSDLDVQAEEINKQTAGMRVLAGAEALLSDAPLVKAVDEEEAKGGEEVLNSLRSLRERVAELQDGARRVVHYQRMFKVAESRYDELQEVADDVELKLALWQALKDWAKLTQDWSSQPFQDLNAQEMEEKVQRYSKLVFKLERGLPPNKVVPRLGSAVDTFKQLVPAIQALRNKALKQRHWDKIEAAVGAALVRDEKFTLGTLLELKVTQHKDEIAGVSTEATQEAALEEMLARVVARWAGIELTVVPYKDAKDTYILGGVEEVIAALDESLVAMSTITASRYVTGIRAEVEKMEKQLSLFSETLDEWLACQKNWMYLESIFSAPDIQRQLPSESKAFFTVDKQLKDIMRRTKDRSNALQAGTTPGWLEAFQKSNETLDRIQKNLEDYLETKRMAFPRFYFLSNDELLEILAQTRNVQAVQPHMSKCFDGIKSLDFGDDPKSIDILAMVSGEGERVGLGKNLKARGNVEQWLTAVEQNMVASLRRLAKAAFQDYARKPRVEWVMEQPAQLVLMISQVYWVKDVTDSLVSEDVTRALEEYHKAVCVAQLNDLSGLVRGALSRLQRNVMTALITIDVHARDIVESLISNKVTSPNDFGWQMQLRYTWDDTSDEAIVRQTNASFLYAYEYLGAQSRLVVTPMTDRCYMTLTGALHLKLGGAPAGPAGTGKTETTKDLAKALGVQCVVFNCGDNLDFKFMGKFFSGLAQCGAWACFDEFNRIDIEVLSVVAQQLLTIQNALRAGVQRFNFEGREIRLVPTCGVFITMNPGYAGRTELPDNLKALFRPMSMMIPDYALVAEVMLFSEGFQNAKALSSKMVKLYKLSSEQLSQQDHYDFGMRALKSVLVMAGALKRANPDLDEDIVLIRAMKDSNLPKFLVDDALLFQAIVSDLFPGASIPDQDYGELSQGIAESITVAGLQPVEAFVTKVIQLYDVLNVRFGAMLVGPTGCGKTACYRTLRDASTLLRERGSTNEALQRTSTYVLNPKCIKMGELYGEYSALTNEWADGLASTIIRECVADTTESRKWVVFDGPVDAIWIENMNTVLDDNRTLCLPNGERIKLNGTTMRMLFEVQDLAVASPATVSRCGMVYVPPECLGWRPVAATWGAQKLPQELSPETKAYVLQLFEEYVDSGLAFVRKHCKEDIPSVNINLVISLMYLMQTLLSPGRGLDFARPPEELHLVVGRLFAFAYVWSLGGNLTALSHEKFDEFVRERLAPIAQFPGQGNVFDYYVDYKEGALQAWEDVVPAFKFSKSVPYFQMLVPTIDTVRYSFLLDASLAVERSVLFTGVTGVGKSVVVVDALNRFAETQNVVPVLLNFSAQTSSIDTQFVIESKLEKKRKTRFGAPVGKRMAIFVDDVNMPARETGFYDRKKLFWKDIEDVTLVAACAPPGGGRNEVTPRFFRHFTMLCIPPPSGPAMRTILGAILNGFLGDGGFQPAVRNLARAVVEASVAMYERICAELLPTPAKSHYTFNLRDLSKVFQGVLMVTPPNCPTPEVLTRLWLHESMRVFHDRLINNQDKAYFKEMAVELLRKHFDSGSDQKDLFEDRTILFGDFMRIGASGEDRVYEELSNYNKLLATLEDYLSEYNMASPSQLALVFFPDAVAHACRAARVLRQPRGNAMLVGVGGSGKQSLTRFAAFMADYKCFQIELKKGYGQSEFREDLRNLYKMAGIAGTPVVFLFTDTQIVEEGFLEDINNILNSGEVPGLYDLDAKERICGEMRPHVQALGLPETREVMYGTFINRVRDNLHVVLCMSPVGNAFRARCRKFPSLINCCTIDWYEEWPEEALLSVSARFLSGVDLGTDAVRTSVARMCVEIHMSVAKAADRFWEELRRRFYTTPKSYLDLIGLYITLLGEKRAELGAARDRLLNGLSKLQETNDVVASMKVELGELQPLLEEKSAATAVLLEKVNRDREAAQQVKAVVGAEEAEVKRKAAETQAMADDAKADLDEALPALQAAVDALSALNKQDITEIKSFPKPPPLVQKTLEAVCVCLGEKTDWDTAKRVLSDVAFIKRLMDYDKDNIPEKVIRQLKKYVDDPVYTPEQVAKQSNAAKSLCMWTRAMDTYSRVAKAVEPKRAALAAAESQLREANEGLRAKQDELARVEAQVADLQKQLDDAQAESESLKFQAAQTSKRLQRAGKLTSGLADEQVRWRATADLIEQQTALLVGDVFLSAAAIAYYGAFTGPYREALVASWVQHLQDAGVPVSADYALRATLSNPVEVREWGIWGLPSDGVSIDNGILVTRARRWPLCIDPQGQANKWVKAMEAKAGLRVTKMTDPGFLRTLENAVRIGCPVLLEDVGETLDPALEPILLKQTVTVGGRTLIRLGDTDVDYDPGFKLYMTTKLANPHYLPEVCIKVTIINFTVTLRGLEEQLLGDVVRRERPDLEELRDRLVVSIGGDKRQLKELEDKILKLLRESKGNILDDEVLINTLNNSKLTSAVIQGRVKEAEETEREINTNREKYRVVARRGSLLYFATADLPLIGPMYQYSLSYFARAFNVCLVNAPPADALEQRLKVLSDYATQQIYINVCRGLFEEHKPLFSFLLCTSILRDAGTIAPVEWNFLLRGPIATGSLPPRPSSTSPWLTEAMWKGVVYLDANVSAFRGLAEDFTTSDGASRWKAFYETAEPHASPLPGDWPTRTDDFQHLCMVKVLREEKVLFGCTRYVSRNLGSSFTESPPFKLEDVFKDTTCATPVTFILSTGADPTAQLQRFGERAGWAPGVKLHMISLGQGQGPIAEMLVAKAAKNGDWVCLQNCHLAVSWMRSLEGIVEGLSSQQADTHPDFRLWLTSMPSPAFPVLVLQNGLKITTEPPKGVRANMLRSYTELPPDVLDSTGGRHVSAHSRLLFSLAFFHAVVQERRKFGPLGWNVKYEFNASDFECSLQTLRMFLTEQAEIPWAALSYVIGEINYGGRVTDDNDRVCLLSILRRYYTPKVVEDDGYTFSRSGTYRAPLHDDVAGYLDYVRGLPPTEAPEVFGMHENANITCQLQETRKMLDTVLSIQPRMASAGVGKSPDQVVAEMAEELIKALPKPLDMAEAGEETFKPAPNGQRRSLAIVLMQEMERFNRLLERLRATLTELVKAIKGLVVMSGELETMYTSMLNNQVPTIWASVAYPSLKPLSSWVRDFQDRFSFMRSWLEKGDPACFWMPGLFFPQGFMTGILQTHARKYGIPIDALTFSFKITDYATAADIAEEPEDGVYISGLFVDGARWDTEQRCIDESRPAEMHAALPVVHFVPAERYKPPVEEYQCPLYKTSVRAGVLSTTGASTNFVLCVSCPVRPGTTPDFWVLQGVALLCQLDE